MKEKELIEFMHSLWNRGLINVSPDEFDYEWVVWDYLKLRQPPVSKSFYCLGDSFGESGKCDKQCDNCRAKILKK